MGARGLRVFLVAGEASGDALGAALMGGLVALAPGVAFEGVGGPRMTEHGLAPLFPIDEIAVMGLAEILPRYLALRRRMVQTADAAIAAAPDVMVTIDAPAFGLSVARRVRAARPEARLVHYVAPSVWAWRPGRAARLRGLVDLVLALLPFEPPLIEAAGVPCRFVGHPVAGRPPPDPAAGRAFRAAHGLSGEVLCVLPGSRRSEVARLAPVLGGALAALVERRPGLRAVVPAAPGVAAMLPDTIADWSGEPVIVPPGDDALKDAALAASDAAIAASGTVSLELARAGVPVVIAYDLHPLTRAVMGRLLRTDTVTLVNLVSETRAVPEFLGRACRPGPIAEAAHALLGDGAAQRAAFATTMERLGAGGEAPGLRAARAVLSAI